MIRCYLVVLRFRPAPNALGFSYDFPLLVGPDDGKYSWILAFGG